MKNIIFFGVLMLSACTPMATAAPTTTLTKQPTFTASDTETPTPIPTNTSIPTASLEPISGSWNTFQSSEYGFSFQYPAVYDEGFKSKTDSRFFCDIQTGEDDEGNFNIWVGNLRVIVKKTNQKLDDFSDDYVKEMSVNWNIFPAVRITLGGVPAVMLEYAHKTRSGRGVKTYVIRNNNLIFLEHYEPSVYIDCAPPDTGYSSNWVYEQIIRTWKFD